jgi:hypothetical protein
VYFSQKKKMTNRKMYSIILFNLIGFTVFSQSIAPTKAEVVITSKQSYGEQMNDAMEAKALRENAFANQEIAAAVKAEAMSAPQKEIILFHEEKISNITHIALVRTTRPTQETYDYFETELRFSRFIIVNPTANKKKFRKDPYYLNEEKNEDWLYLFYALDETGVDTYRYVILKDYQGNILYKSKNLNIPFFEVLSQITEL